MPHPRFPRDAGFRLPVPRNAPMTVAGRKRHVSIGVRTPLSILQHHGNAGTRPARGSPTFFVTLSLGAPEGEKAGPDFRSTWRPPFLFPACNVCPISGPPGGPENGAKKITPSCVFCHPGVGCRASWKFPAGVRRAPASQRSRGQRNPIVHRFRTDHTRVPCVLALAPRAKGSGGRDAVYHPLSTSGSSRRRKTR